MWEIKILRYSSELRAPGVLLEVQPATEVTEDSSDTARSARLPLTVSSISAAPRTGKDAPRFASPHSQLRPPDSPVLARLIVLVAMGDHDAFRHLYDATAPKLFAVALRISREESRAEDVLQDSFVNIWNGASGYDTTLAAPMAWLMTIVRNRSLDYIRRTDRRMVELDAELEATLELQEPGPAELAMQTQDADALRRCLKVLDAGQRQALTFAYFHGLTHSELAIAMCIPLGTAKTWIRRGLETMRHSFEDS